MATLSAMPVRSRNWSGVSRMLILREVYRALRDAVEHRRRNAVGDYSPDPKSERFPEWQPLQSSSSPAAPPSSPSSEAKRVAVSLMGLVDDWWKEAQATGSAKPSTYRSHRTTIAAFVEFVGHDDACRITKENVNAFKVHLLATKNSRTGRPLSGKTVKDSYLAGLKTVFGWAVTNGRIESNPAAGATLKLRRARKVRDKHFTDEEANAILKAAWNLEHGREGPKTLAAKKWVPWLLAYTGARVGEIAQLRKKDVRQEGDYWIIKITPEAGTVKTDEARDVVVHPHLIELGFATFVQEASPGHLFLTPGKDDNALGPLQGVKNRIREFVRTVIVDKDVAPNHGWRHRFKTVCREVGIDAEVRDFIQGHAPLTSGGSYGTVTLKTQAAAIAKLPRYEV